MTLSFSKESLAIDLHQQIDERCTAFEQIWKDGRVPRLEDFVADSEPTARTALLRELLILELHYRRNDQGTRPSDVQICELHPTLMPDVAEQLQVLRNERQAKQGQPGQIEPGLDGDIYRTMPPQEEYATIDAANIGRKPNITHDSKSSGSRGLHIRCPHCSNPVELLSDTPLESITCRTCGSSFSLVDHVEETEQAPTLKRIGRFELVARLGLGGFGTVWKARDTDLDRAVAVKIPRKGQLSPEEVEQFLREARLAAQLQHANIVPVHEVGRDGDSIFIVSDLIRGVSLSDWLAVNKPGPRIIAALMATISDALHHAHQKGVIHRDLKPSNILLDENNQPHIMDFGLAKREIGEITMTADGHILGTPAYMSPEQARGQAHSSDRRTDIYSLGVILFKMLTGELPFRGSAQMQVHQRITEDAPNPRTLNRYIRRDLATICVKCLERVPASRYATAADLADEFRRFLRGEPIHARPISSLGRLIRWSKRKPMTATSAALVLFLAIAGPLTAIYVHRQSAEREVRLNERIRLVEQSSKESGDAAAKLALLRNELDAYKGKLNPSELWPPRKEAGPRTLLVDDLYSHGVTGLDGKLRSGDFDSATIARGYFGVAMLAEAKSDVSKAAEYYGRARDQLVALHKQQPFEARLTRALADCYTQLAQLAEKEDRALASANYENARKLYEQLAADQKGDARPGVDWFESELRSAALVSSESVSDKLARAEQIKGTLRQQWSSDPNELYMLSCYLVQHEPILAPAPSAKSANESRPHPIPAKN